MDKQVDKINNALLIMIDILLAVFVCVAFIAGIFFIIKAAADSFTGSVTGLLYNAGLSGILGIILWASYTGIYSSIKRGR